jgi:hypothetical protein
MKLGNPILKDLITVIDAQTNAINKLNAGTNPHKEEDTTDVITALDALNLDMVGDLEKQLNVDYTAHIGSTSYHVAADSTNTAGATTVYAKIKALADNLGTKYAAHRVLTSGTVHAFADATDVVTADATSSKATAITYLNNLKAMLNAHMANATSHVAADATNPVVLTDLATGATWSQIQAMVDAIRVSYEAHRVLTAGGVHGAADNTNSATVAAVGSVQTSVDTNLTDIKAKFNAHVILTTSHYIADEEVIVTAAAATDLSTSVTLANALKKAFNDHLGREDNTVPTLDSL